jgi:hypothetical protein
VVAASTVTGPDGSFRLALLPGSYQMSARAGMRCLPQTVSVQAGRYSAVTIQCDSGIR